MTARRFLPQFLEDGDDEDWGTESVVSVPNSFQYYNTLDEAETIAQLTTAKEQIKVPNSVVVVPYTDKKQPKKKPVKKPDNINGAIPTEKQKYYLYLTFTTLQLYSKDIYNKENDLVSAISEAFCKDNKEKLSNKINVETGGFEDTAVIQHLKNGEQEI